MSIEKFAGIETEFGIAGGEAIAAATEVVTAYRQVALGEGECYEGPNPFVAAGRSADLMLPNGARYYVDHAHPEFSTAESSDARTVVALERAGAELVRRCAEAVNRKHPKRKPIRIYKNNSDHLGNSYGCHENYLVDAPTYTSLFGGRAHWLFTYMIPFLVSRIVVCGAGKVGAENGEAAVDYQISQRADFQEQLVGLQTTHSRPIVNTRDEPHADAARFRRLHVIAGDANMCPYAAWLKIGTMQIFLRLLEDGALGSNLVLAEPLRAVREISRDLTCRHAVPLEDGRSLSAIEIQLCFLDHAQAYFSSHEATEGEALVLRHWADTLAELRRDPEELVGKLDWVTKWRIISELSGQEGWGLDSPHAMEADAKYHALARGESLFSTLEEMGLVVEPPGWDMTWERTFLTTPPADSRAYLRGRCIAKFSHSIDHADWSELSFGKERLSLPVLNGIGPGKIDEVCNVSKNAKEFSQGVADLCRGLAGGEKTASDTKVSTRN